ncbi:MAG TPA: D-arabinono-1,4-lactone oxidase, partial [Candidatus Acidoferrum sp.]|nr:D-arabinono-1,4-lactone oxidase [Candidatus Acidoferrum sp.]
LTVQPTFRVRQDLYENLSLEAAADHFDDLTSLGDSVSLFTDWQEPTFEQVWVKRRVPPDDAFRPSPTLYGATIATIPLHPIRRMAPDACTEQLGVPGPWHDRLPHFRMDHTPSAGNELQSEYFVPRRHAVDAMTAVHAIRRRLEGLLQIGEVRTIAADDLWLSPAFGRPSVALHFTWFPDWGRVTSVLPTVEDALRPFEPRPHWGKVFALSADELRSRYDRLPEFAALARRLDPNGRFRNAFVDRVLGP